MRAMTSRQIFRASALVPRGRRVSSEFAGFLEGYADECDQAGVAPLTVRELAALLQLVTSTSLLAHLVATKLRLEWSPDKLNAIATRLNERPGKTLNCETPAARFHQFVASTG